MGYQPIQQGASDAVSIYRAFIDNATTNTNGTSNWTSIPTNISNDIILIVYWSSRIDDFSASYGGSSLMKFIRNGGTISNQGPQKDNLTGNISGTKPSITLTANTGTNNIDINITGKASTNLVWSAYFDLIIHS